MVSRWVSVPALSFPSQVLTRCSRRGFPTIAALPQVFLTRARARARLAVHVPSFRSYVLESGFIYLTRLTFILTNKNRWLQLRQEC